VKNEPILVVFGIQNLEETSHQIIINHPQSQSVISKLQQVVVEHSAYVLPAFTTVNKTQIGKLGPCSVKVVINRR